MLDNVVLGKLPHLLIAAIIKSDAFNSTVTENPYAFNHYGLTRFACFLNSTCKESIILHHGAGANNAQLTSAYYKLQNMLGIANSNAANMLELTDFNGKFFIGVDLSDHKMARSGLVNPIKTGNIRVELDFQGNLDSPLTLILVSEYDSAYSINKFRQVDREY